MTSQDHIRRGGVLSWSPPRCGVPRLALRCAVRGSLGLINRTVVDNVAMTGEVSLRGLVLPVGGIKEKTVAAHRAGIRKVLLPARNRKDLEDVPKSVRDEVQFVFCERVEDVVREALGLDLVKPVTAAA